MYQVNTWLNLIYIRVMLYRGCFKRAEKILLMTPGKSGLPGNRQAIIIRADCLQGSKTFNSYNLTVKNENTSV